VDVVSFPEAAHIRLGILEELHQLQDAAPHAEPDLKNKNTWNKNTFTKRFNNVLNVNV
jgi:hypothetical protein